MASAHRATLLAARSAVVCLVATPLAAAVSAPALMAAASPTAVVTPVVVAVSAIIMAVPTAIVMPVPCRRARPARLVAVVLDESHRAEAYRPEQHCADNDFLHNVYFSLNHMYVPFANIGTKRWKCKYFLLLKPKRAFFTGHNGKKTTIGHRAEGLVTHYFTTALTTNHACIASVCNRP